MAEEPDYVYYDMTYDNYQSTTSEPSQLQFKETRNSPIIKKPEDYNMSIIRFQLDTISLPSYIMPIQPNQNNNKLSIYSVNIVYVSALGVETSVAPTYLLWLPFHRDIAEPAAPNTTSNGFQVDTPYYYGYSFSHFAYIMNTALTTAFNAIKTNIGAGFPAGAVAPFIYFNHDNNKFSLVGDRDFYNINNGGVHLRIYFNRPLYGILSSFPSYRYATNANNNIFLIQMTGEKGTNLKTNALWGAATYIDLPQEFPTLSNFSPVSSIVFTTSQLPIVPNALSAPLIFNNNELVSDANQNNLTALIITDMANNDDFSYKANLLYAPSAEYRRVSLTSNRPILNVDIQVYWKDTKGILRPFLLWSGGKASIKIMFEKKK